MVKEESCSFFALLSLYMGREVLEPSWWKAIPLAAAKVWHPEVLLYVSYVHHFLKRTTGKNGSNRYTTSLPQWQAITQLPIYSWASSSLSTSVQNKGTESSQLPYCWSGRHWCPWEQPHCQISPRSSCWSVQLLFLKYGVGQKVLFEVRSNICSKMLQKIQMNFLANAIFFLLFLFGHSVVSDSLWPHGLQHARLLCPSPTPGACSNSCPLSRWCHPIISSSVVPFSSCLQSFSASGSFLMSRLFTSGAQSTGT